MWFFAVLFIGAFILSAFFAPKPKIENARAASLSDFNFPRAKEGDPIPRGYGTWKTKGPNCIYVGDFKAEPIKKKVKTGLFSSKKQIVGYKYYIGIDMAVALGPCVTFRRMWLGKNEVWNDCITDCAGATPATIDLPELYGGQDKNGGIGGNVTFYAGNFDQTQDAYLVSKLGSSVPAYVGVAHVVFEQFYFGNSPTVEPVSFEVSHFSDSLGLSAVGKHIMPNLFDANPIEVLYDIYVNDWGNLGMDAAGIDDANWFEAGETIWDEGNGVSFEIGNAQEGKDITKEILRQINAMVYQDPTTGYIKIKLLRADYDIETLPVYGPSEISLVRDYTKKLWEDTINRVRIKYQDRDKNWADDAIALADDFANIRYQNRIRAVEIGMPCLKVGELANEIAARELANLNIPLFQAEIESNRTAVPLGPGDVFILNWPEYDIEQMVVRIRKFGLGSRENGKVSMFVVQDEFAVDATVYSTPELPSGDGGTYEPGDIADYKLFELPWFLNNAAGFEAIEGFTRYGSLVSKPAPASIEYFLLIDDPEEDVEVLSNAPYAATATLAGALDQWEGFATGVVSNLIIDELSSTSALVDRDEASVKAGQNLFYLNDEILAYETFTNNGDGTYTLHNVHRSMIDTGWFGHAANDTLFFFDGQEGFVDDEIEIAPFDAYMLDRSVLGRSLEADAVMNNLTPIGRRFLPAPPDYVTADSNRVSTMEVDAGASVELDWIERNRLSTTLDLEADVTTAAEAATTYDIELRTVIGDTLVADELGVAAPYTFAIPASDDTYEAVFLVYAVRDGDRSFTGAPFPITVLGSEVRQTEDGDNRMTEDDDLRIGED